MASAATAGRQRRGGMAKAMTGFGSSPDDVQGEAMRRRMFWFPLVAGAALLSIIWTAMAAMLALNGGMPCFGEPGLRGVGNQLAHEMGIWDETGPGAALGLLTYVGVSLLPFLLVSGCVRLAARRRTTCFLAVLAIVGTAFVTVYDVLGFWAAYVDLAQGGFLCSLAFELVPIGGVIAGACAVIVGSLAALVIEWRWRARS
jgi:hypothetical protein